MRCSPICPVLLIMTKTVCYLGELCAGSRESQEAVLRGFHIPRLVALLNSTCRIGPQSGGACRTPLLAAVHTPSTVLALGLRHGLLTPARQALNPPTQDLPFSQQCSTASSVLLRHTNRILAYSAATASQ